MCYNNVGTQTDYTVCQYEKVCALHNVGIKSRIYLLRWGVGMPTHNFAKISEKPQDMK